MMGHLAPEQLRGMLPSEAAARREALHHLAVCAPCRARFLQDAPERVFALLALAPLPETVLDEVSDGVRHAVAQGRAKPPRRALWWAAAAAAALLLAVGVLWQAWSPGWEVRTPLALQPRLPAPQGEAGEGEEVRLLASPGDGQLVDFEIGEVKLVMIFDERLEL